VVFALTLDSRLDLIVANRVHLVEPQWNPSIESQAIGRTTRIGQKKSVQITRYIVSNTVEKVSEARVSPGLRQYLTQFQEMQQLQQRKMKMAGMASTLDSNDAEPKIKTEVDNGEPTFLGTLYNLCEV